MLNRLFVCFVAAIFAVCIGYAVQSNPVAAAPTNKIPPSDGKAMFVQYCTPCHGADGKGRGPVVMENKVPPVDLTGLSKKNHGKFPEERVVHVLKYGADVPSHTSVEMPVWGPILGKINQSDPRDKELRISALSQYLETIQMK
jgi:mono/diheme cytochrome c family protein